MAHVRRLRSGRWQATVRHPSGQRYSKSDPLKRVVVEWAAEAESRMRRGDFIDPNAGKMTLADWWAKWLTTRRAQKATRDKNASQWRRHVEPAFGRWPLAAIASWDVEAWVTEMGELDEDGDRVVGPTTAAASLRLLTQLLNAAVKHRLIGANPAAMVKPDAVPPHEARFLSHAEADQLVDRFAGQDRLLVELLLNTGLRWSEAAALDGVHVKLLKKHLTVRQALDRAGRLKPPKSDAGVRDVPLVDELVLPLSQQIAGLDEPLFRGADGSRLDYHNWRHRVWLPAVIGRPATKDRPAVVGAGLEDPQPTPHDLRHTYGSWLADAKVPVHEIAALMGHSDWRMTQRYVHASEARMERAREALERSPRAAGERQEGVRTTVNGEGL